MQAKRNENKAKPLVIFICGSRMTGKDFVANVIRKTLAGSIEVQSISDGFKRLYAKHSNINFEQLLADRDLKEKHRLQMIEFYEKCQTTIPYYNERCLLHLVGASKADILIITGAREPNLNANALMLRRDVILVHVVCSDLTMKQRGFLFDPKVDNNPNEKAMFTKVLFDLTLANDHGEEHIVQWTKTALAPRITSTPKTELQDYIQNVPNFPKPGIVFRDILGIMAQPAALKLCVHMLTALVPKGVEALVSVETGGVCFAAPLALHLSVPLVILRKAAKIPGPDFRCPLEPSHITASLTPDRTTYLHLPLGVLVPKSRVLVLDDVLASGCTLRSVLSVLDEAEVEISKILVVAEFPDHGGRQVASKRGVELESLVQFSGL